MDHMKFYGSATVGTKGQIVIPVEAREQLSINEGAKLVIVRAPHGEGLLLLKSETVEKMLSHMQSEFSSIVSSIKDTETQEGAV